VPDVSLNLAREIRHGRKDATRQEITPDLCLRLMGRQIVSDHVNLSPGGLAGEDLAEKPDERRAGVSRHGLADHLARLGVERGK